MTAKTLRVTVLYPDRMNIYADRGNLIFLRRRCEWRGIGFELTSSVEGDQVDPDGVDLLYIGGGQDRDQMEIAEDLISRKREGISAALDGGAALLAVCGGFQLLGRSYSVGDHEIQGLGFCDLETKREAGARLIGNVEVEVDGLEGLDGPRKLVGFENHGGRTYLGDAAKPLGRVVRGNGNNGRDATEGVLDGRLIGTYLHGPLLPKNVWFADWLIATALAEAGRPPIGLEPLDDTLEEAAHSSALRAAGR